MLLENGWKILGVTYGSCSAVKAEKNHARVSISFEVCLCHGGRMWIYEEHTDQTLTIEHATYDESLGITDGWSEIDYIVEHEMLDKINEFKGFIYKLTKINEYGKHSSGVNKEDVSYYADIKYLTKHILDGETTDIADYNQIEKEKINYPNRNIYATVERIFKQEEYSFNKDRVWFKHSRYERKDDKGEFKLDREFEMFVTMFNKK